MPKWTASASVSKGYDLLPVFHFMEAVVKSYWESHLAWPKCSSDMVLCRQPASRAGLELTDVEPPTSMALVCSRAKVVRVSTCLLASLLHSASLCSASVRAACSDVRSSKRDVQLSSDRCSCSCSCLARSSAADAAALTCLHRGLVLLYTIIIKDVSMSTCTRTCSRK